MKRLKKFLIPLLLCSLVCFIPETRAEVIEATASFNDVPGGTTVSVPGNGSRQYTLYLYNYEGVTRPYVYLTFSVCTNGPNNYSITNVGYSNYFLEDSIEYYNAGKSCTVNGYGGSLFYVQVKVGKYEDLDGTGEELVASSYFNISNTWSYGVYYHFKNFYLSSDDTMEAMRSNKEILNKFNAIDDDLNTMNSNLSSINGILSSNSDKIDQTNDKLDDVNQNLGDLNDNITNGDISGSQNTANGFFDDFTDNDYGLSSILTIPLSSIQKITNASCSPINIPIPFTNKNIPLPCMGTLYQQNVPVLLNIWQIVSFGIISYAIIVDIFGMVKKFKDPNDDKLEVMSL